MKEEEKKALTFADLQRAVDVINEFATMYSKAESAVKRLAKEQGRYSSMFGRGADPITSMLFSQMEGMMERKMEELVEKRIGQLPATSVEEAKELAEAKSGLDGSEEEEEKEET